MNKWNDLTMKERAAFIKVGVANGFRNIDDIRDQYNSFYSDQQNYNFDKSLAINCFKDGVIAIANLYDPSAKHFKKFCPKETWPGGDHTYVWKNCVSLPQTVKYKKDDNGKWRRI